MAPAQHHAEVYQTFNGHLRRMHARVFRVSGYDELGEVSQQLK